MPSLQLILCGGNDSLAHLLRQAGNAAFDIVSIPAKAAAPADPRVGQAGLVVVVHQAPRSDGAACIRSWIRDFPSIPVLAFTNDFSGDTTRLLFKSGAVDVLALPGSFDKVLACLEAYFPGFSPAGSRQATRKGLRAGVSGKLMLGALAPGLVVAGTQHFGSYLPETLPEPASIVQELEHSFHGLQVRFFGPFTVLVHGLKLELPNQARQILAYLALNHNRPILRDTLARIFWPEKYENAPHTARRGLNVEITRIRNAFRTLTGIDDDFIVFKDNCYRLDKKRPFQTDVEEFKQINRSIQEYLRQEQAVPENLFQMALKTYAGNFLEDFPDDNNNWVEIERQHYGSIFEQIADRYSEQLCTKGEYWKASGVCIEMLSRDQRMEVIHRRLMHCYFEQGRMDRVEQQYKICCQMAEREFESKPSPETIRLYEQLRH